MKGIAGKVLTALGVIFVLAAVLWWTVGLGMLLKIPKGVDEVLYFEGDVTMYVNPATYQPLPEGQEIEQPYSATRHIESIDEEYDSSTAVIRETVEANIVGMAHICNVYTIDRKSQINVEDDRAYAYREDIDVNRAGSYVLFPLNVSEEEVFPFWKNECNAAFDMVYLGRDEKEGLEVYNFGTTFEEEPAWDAFLGFMGMPTEVTFDQLAAQLSAQGVDMEGLMSLAASALTPDDLQSLQQATQQPIPIYYYYSQAVEMSVEPVTGAIVDLYRNVEGLSMEPDYSGLAPVFSVLMKYQQDPVLGPALQQLADLQARFADAGPQKIMEYSYQQTPESVSEAVDKAKSGKSMVGLVKLWAPLIAIILGVLLLATGFFFLRKVRASKSSS